MLSIETKLRWKLMWRELIDFEEKSVAWHSAPGSQQQQSKPSTGAMSFFSSPAQQPSQFTTNENYNENSSQFSFCFVLLHLSLKPRVLSPYLTDKAHQLLENEITQQPISTNIGPSRLQGPCGAHFAEAPLSNWQARNCNSSSIVKLVEGVNNIMNDRNLNNRSAQCDCINAWGGSKPLSVKNIDSL